MADFGRDLDRASAQRLRGLMTEQGADARRRKTEPTLRSRSWRSWLHRQGEWKM